MSTLAIRQQRVGSAIRLVDTKQISQEEWLRHRKRGIGASEAGTALGVNPYQTPYELWRVKTGLDADADLSGIPAVDWGLWLEDPVANKWAAETGRRIERVNAILQSPAEPHMLCNLDRRVVGEEAVLEVKTAGEWAARADMWGPSGTDQVPLHYLCQLNHQMIICGYKLGYLAVLIGGQEFRHYTIHRDEELVAMMLEREREFWRRVVEKDPPPPTTVNDVLLAFPRSAARPIDATLEIENEILEFIDLRREAKRVDADLEERKLRICAFMGEHDELISSDGTTLATFRTGKNRSAFDAKRHADEDPACHELFTRNDVPGTRPLLVKEPQ